MCPSFWLIQNIGKFCVVFVCTSQAFNYVQCPRNYCDGVTLNQCLINNKNNNNNWSGLGLISPLGFYVVTVIKSVL